MQKGLGIVVQGRVLAVILAATLSRHAYEWIQNFGAPYCLHVVFHEPRTLRPTAVP